MERSRQVPYTATTTSLAPAQLRATLADAGALSGSSFTVERRNVTYTVTVTACSIDDPSDGAGYGNASFRAAPTTTTGPGSPPPGPAAAVNVLGIAVSLGGSLLATVCNAVGTNSALLATLTSAVSTVAPLSLCASTASGSVQYDSRPDDLRRVRIDVAWTQGTSASVSQTALLTNSLPNNCPLTTPAAPATLPTGCPAPRRSCLGGLHQLGVAQAQTPHPGYVRGCAEARVILAADVGSEGDDDLADAGVIRALRGRYWQLARDSRSGQRRRAEQRAKQAPDKYVRLAAERGPPSSRRPAAPRRGHGPWRAARSRR